MIVTKDGTTIEGGDPILVSFRMGNCPLCGCELPNANWTTGGHVHSGITSQCILFSACSEHYEEAQKVPTKNNRHDRAGYVGEWEPCFGLLAEVCYHRDDNRRELIRLVDGSKFKGANDGKATK